MIYRVKTNPPYLLKVSNPSCRNLELWNEGLDQVEAWRDDDITLGRVSNKIGGISGGSSYKNQEDKGALALKTTSKNNFTVNDKMDSYNLLIKGSPNITVLLKPGDTYEFSVNSKADLFFYLNMKDEYNFKILNRSDYLSPTYDSLEVLGSWIYKFNYSSLDYDYAYNYFSKIFNTDSLVGMCSSIRKDNLYGRHYDWNYDNLVTCAVITEGTETRIGSKGLAGGIPGLTSDFISRESKYSEIYSLLPFYLLDGRNDFGVTCNINVVPIDDCSVRTTGTTPRVEKRDTVCTRMLVRYILDKFQTASEAIEYIQDYVSIYATNNEVHFMICDLTSSYIMEFVNNEIVIMSDQEDTYPDIPNNRCIMTNFYMNQWDGDTTSMTVPCSNNTLLSYSQGLERYQVLNEGYSSIDNIASLKALMNSVRYTSAYSLETNPFWYSEFVGKFPEYDLNLKITSSKAEMDILIPYILENFNKRNRDTGSTWQTVHASYYDMETGDLYVQVQEENAIYSI